MKIKRSDWWYIVPLILIFIIIVVIILSYCNMAKATDKSPYNLFGHSSPSTPFSEWWCTFWDEHIDWQTTGKTNYYDCATRSQPVGTYELILCWAETRESDISHPLEWLLTYCDSMGVHRDSVLAHVDENSYYHPRLSSEDFARLIPGWDPANDVGGNWVRDYKADYDYNNATTYFTVDYDSDYIEDAGGGRMGTWTVNEWQGDYVKMGWGGNADTVSFVVASNTTTQLYLTGEIPSHTYLWYIVDKSSAVNHNAVAMADSFARIHPGAWEYRLINPKHWLAKAFVGRFFHAVIHTDLLSREPTDIYPDDILKTYVPYSCGSGWCDHWTMGSSSLEGLDDDNVYRPAVREFLGEVKDSLGAGNFLLVNVYEVNVGWDSIVLNSVSGLWHETWLLPDVNRSDFNTKLNKVKLYKNSPYNYKLQFLHGGGGLGAVPLPDLNRAKMNQLTQYYIQYSDSFYFLYNTNPAYGTQLGDTTKWWFGLMGIDLGEPTDTAEEVLENGKYVWKRPFPSGYVIWKPKPESGSNYTDSTLHTLPAYYYQLDINGSIVGDSVNQVYVKNCQGLVFQATGSEPPPAQGGYKWNIRK